MIKHCVIKRCLLYVFAMLVLIPALFLHGCEISYEPSPESPKPVETPVVSLEPSVSPPSAAPRVYGRFTLRYDSKSTMNPITGLNRDNILLSSLMYESLFVLDGGLNAEPLLCESWSTEDYTTFKFEIKPDIAMSDGSRLTADDVSYTLRQSMQRGRFINRFGNVANVSSNGDLTVTVVLRMPDFRFITLLDVPIIKNGSIDNRVPPGTGPYTFINEDILRLEGFSRYRDYNRLPLSVIYLLECGDDDLTQFFDDGKISLLLDDPFDAFNIRLNRLHEKRYFDTTTLQFIGFNAKEGVLRDPDVRRAIGCSIERDYIVNEIMAGQAVAAPIPLPPTFWLYDKQWESHDFDPLTEMTLLLKRANMDDYNEDSFLEQSDGHGGYISFSVDFIVNSENLYRVQAAYKIADTLRQYGFMVNVRELTWENFMSALKSGDFDMYYGETTLSADFDLSPLLLPGNLNYGGTASNTYRPFIEDFLTAREEYEVQYAVTRLLNELTTNAPFVPVLYKRYVIYSPMGAITGADPSQSTVFRDFKDWKIDLTMLN